MHRHTHTHTYYTQTHVPTGQASTADAESNLDPIMKGGTSGEIRVPMAEFNSF